MNCAILDKINSNKIQILNLEKMPATSQKNLTNIYRL